MAYTPFDVTITDDQGVPEIGATIEARDVLTQDAVTFYGDLTGAAHATPYETDSAGRFVGLLAPDGPYEWRASRSGVAIPGFDWALFRAASGFGGEALIEWAPNTAINSGVSPITHSFVVPSTGAADEGLVGKIEVALDFAHSNMIDVRVVLGNTVATGAELLLFDGPNLGISDYAFDGAFVVTDNSALSPTTHQVADGDRVFPSEGQPTQVQFAGDPVGDTWVITILDMGVQAGSGTLRSVSLRFKAV